MLNTKVFDDLADKLGEAIKSSPVKDMEKNARALLMQGFAKLELVTREEFDIQARVLARTREQLSQLQDRVAELEAKREAVSK
jgi:ubiquinone biosynthesis accessory factor UbiK